MPAPGNVPNGGVSSRFGSARGSDRSSPQRVARQPEQARGRASRSSPGVGFGRRRLRRRRQLASLGRQVEQQAHDLGAGQAVDQRVVDLREHRDCPAAGRGSRRAPTAAARGRAAARRSAPPARRAARRCRARAARARARGSRGRSPGRRPSTGSRGRAAPRPAASGTAAAAAGARRAAACTSPASSLPSGAVRGVEDREPADMPALARRLERQELRVEAGQLSHAPTAARPSARAGSRSA